MDMDEISDSLQSAIDNTDFKSWAGNPPKWFHDAFEYHNARGWKKFKLWFHYKFGRRGW